ncbi:MAG: hypothetical protein H6712_23500 [Myxococcales bacterium]|nr:hypothetical protein [Myxococcales bacterium]
MAPRKILLAVFLGACSALTAASPVQAAQSSPRCDDMLIDLGSMQAALDQMEKAVAANDTHQQDLRTEASTLAATIAERLRGGASQLEVEPLLDRRAAALKELDQAQSLRPVLEGQLEALVLEVDHAERDYIACVESSIE